MSTSPSFTQFHALQRRFFISPTSAILFYDFLLTLGTESKRFWERPAWSTAAVLFYLNRYGAMSGYIAITYFFFAPDFLVNSNVCRFPLPPLRSLTSHAVRGRIDSLHIHRASLNKSPAARNLKCLFSFTLLIRMSSLVVSNTIKSSIVRLQPYTHSYHSGILILRTSALYNNDRRVKYALSSLIILMSINGGVRRALPTY